MYRHPLSHYFLVLLTLSHHADFALFGCDCAHPHSCSDVGLNRGRANGVQVNMVKVRLRDGETRVENGGCVGH